MTELNYRVDYRHETPRAVAQDFLRRRGLWHAPLPAGRCATIRLGSKIFAEQYILAEMYAALIRGYTNLDVTTKTGLGGTSICFEALRTGAIDLYPEYTGTGLLVLLQPPPAIVDSLGGNPRAVSTTYSAGSGGATSWSGWPRWASIIPTPCSCASSRLTGCTLPRCRSWVNICAGK